MSQEATSLKYQKQVQQALLQSVHKEKKRQSRAQAQLQKDNAMKNNHNPFIKAVARANQVSAAKQRQEESKMAQLNTSATSSQQAQQDLNIRDKPQGENANLDYLRDIDPTEIISRGGYLPKNSQQYLKSITTSIDTNQIYEIVQVFSHKQNHQGGARMVTQQNFENSDIKQSVGSGTNDYVVIVLKINSSELRQFYGNGKYLVQIWKNKSRLYQHVHDYDIKKIFLNKTELAYMLNVPKGGDLDTFYQPMEKAFDSHMDFIYVIQPFTQNFVRIKYPFDDDYLFDSGKSQQSESNIVLFINDEFLVVAHNNSLKYIKTDTFLSQTKNSDQKIGMVGQSNRKASLKSDQKQIKYFQEYSVNTNNDNFYKHDTAENPRAKVKRRGANRIGSIYDDIEEFAHEPNGFQNCKNSIRHKEMANSRSLYGQSKDYQKAEVVTIEFRNCILIGKWKILAINETFSRDNSANNIVIYASMDGSLILQLFRLCTENIHHQASHESINDSFSSSIVDSGSNGNSSIDFEEIGGQKGVGSKNDSYVKLQLINISDNQTLTILQSQDGHTDIVSDLHKDKTKDECERLSDKLNRDHKIQGSIKKIIFGSEKLHIEIKQKSQRESKIYQIGLNMQTLKVDYQSKVLMPSFMTSILDEDFYQSHIKIYEDIKILSDLLLLTHGQCVTLYNITTKQWSHYFNRKSIQQSNEQTKEILKSKHDFGSPEDDIKNILSGKTDEDAEKKFKMNFSHHCHFNKKGYEVIESAFLQIKSDNVYELLVRQQGGQIRKVCIIFPKSGSDSSKSLNNSQGLLFENFDPMALDDKLDSVSVHKPKIIVQSLLSKCATINKETQYEAVSLNSQTNISLYKEMGIFESRVLLDVEFFCKVEGKSRGLYSNSDDQINGNNISKLLNLDFDNQLRMLQVQNSKLSHLFLFDKSTKCLNVYNVEESMDTESKCLSIEALSQRLMIQVPNFDYSPHAEYFLDKQLLQYVWRGDFYQVDLITGVKEKQCFGRSIIDGQYCILPGKQIYYKSKGKKLHFVDLKWHKSGFQKSGKQISSLHGLKSREIMQNQSTFCNRIEYDPVNNQLVTFTSPSVLSVFPNLSDTEREFEGSFAYEKRFIAGNFDRTSLKRKDDKKQHQNEHLVFKKSHEIAEFQKYMQPSEFLSKFCALDAENDTIRVWDCGTGKILKDIKHSTDQQESFKGYVKHNYWQGHTLVLKDRKTIMKQLEQAQQEMFARNKKASIFDSTGDIRRSSRINTQVQLKRQVSTTIKKSLDSLQPMEQRDIWRKIRVDENGVIVEKEFYHNFKPGSQVYLGSSNEILLEFFEETIQIYHVRDNGYSDRLHEIPRMSNLTVPAYFNKDFKKYMLFRQQLRRQRRASEGPQEEKDIVRIYQTQETFAKLTNIKQYQKFEEITDLQLPELDKIQKNSNGHPYIQFFTNNKVTYLDKCNVEQTIKTCTKQELLDRKQLIYEKFMTDEMVQFRKQFDSLNFENRQINCLHPKQKFLIKHKTMTNFYGEMKRINDLKEYHEISMKEAITKSKSQMIISRESPHLEVMGSYVINNLRFTQPYSFNLWRIIEIIVSNEATLDDIDPSLLPELSQVILPDGQTLTNMLIRKRNMAQLDRLINVVKVSRSGDPRYPLIPFEMIPDMHGITALHICVDQHLTKAAEEILDLLGHNPLGDHLQIIEDILPGLVETCPLAMSKYFEARMIECSWAPKHTKGNLKTADEDVDFGVYSNPLICMDQQEFEEVVFEKEGIIQEKLRNNTEQKSLPMMIKVFDFAKLHQFESPIGKALVTAISESDEISIFDQKYIQAILEFQWPAIRAVIIRDLFIPYMVFLAVFNYYAIIQFEWEVSETDSSPSKFETFFVRILLFILSIYFLANEYLQLKNEVSPIKYFTSFWNYIDLIPVLLVLSALSVHSIMQIGDIQSHSLHLIRYLNAVASFFIWLKFLYFFRIFRNFGHLISTIMEVIKDMQVFMMILTLSLFAFAGTFFILAQNNNAKNEDDKDVFARSSYIQAFMQMFQLMLGDFDTDDFGETGYGIVYLMFALASIFLIIVMLNLLIAIISDTFAEVQSQAKRKMYQEFSQLICENYHLLSEAEKSYYDSKGNYLFISQIDQGISKDEGDQMSHAEYLRDLHVSKKLDKSQMDVIEGMISERFEAMETNMKTMIRVQDFDMRKDTDLTSDRNNISNVLHDRIEDGFNGFD